MAENILEKIIKKKIEKIENLKKTTKLETLIESIDKNNSFINFKDKIQKNINNRKLSIIAEIKKASPSAGIIIKDYNPVEIADTYNQNKVTCLSVLTEEDFFLGKLEYIKNIKKICKIPILCKDFFIDTYQIPLAKSYGADCILIILSAVDKMLAKDLYQAANNLEISTLIEVHTEKEAELALSFENSLIGINNRNLKTLEISLETSLKLSKILKSHNFPLICESGINSPDNIKFIMKEAKIFNFLIGESLLKSSDIGLKLKQFTQITL